MDNFGRNVKWLVKHYDTTSDKLAQDIGITSGALSSYITGRVIPKVDIVRKIAKRFKVTIDALVNGDLSKEQGDTFVDESPNSDVIINLLAKEVRRLREQIEEHGSTIDKERADKAIEDAINGMKEDKGNGK